VQPPASKLWFYPTDVWPQKEEQDRTSGQNWLKTL